MLLVTRVVGGSECGPGGPVTECKGEAWTNSNIAKRLVSTWCRHTVGVRERHL